MSAGPLCWCWVLLSGEVLGCLPSRGDAKVRPFEDRLTSAVAFYVAYGGVWLRHQHSSALGVGDAVQLHGPDCPLFDLSAACPACWCLGHLVRGLVYPWCWVSAGSLCWCWVFTRSVVLSARALVCCVGARCQPGVLCPNVRVARVNPVRG